MKNQSEWFQPKEEVYMLFLVAHALSSKPHLYTDITDVYQQRELTYYQAYRSYEVDLQQAFCHYPFEQVNAMIQSLGILQVSHMEQSYEAIWPLIRKGYGMVWKHCKIHKEFNFEKIKGELAKRSNGFLDAEETANLFFIGIYLSTHKKDVSLFTDYSVVDEELRIFMGDILDKFKNEPEERVPLFSPIHEQVGRETPLDDLEQHIQFFKKSEHIEDFISKILRYEVEKSRKKEKDIKFPHSLLHEVNLNSSSSIEQFERHLNNLFNEEVDLDSVSQEGWSKYLLSLRAVMMMHQFDPTTLGKQQKINKSKISDFYQIIGFLRKDFNYSVQEIMQALVFHYYLSIIEAEYSKLRNLVSDGSRERYMMEKESYEREITSLREENRQMEQTLLTDKKTLQVQLNRALEENQKLSQQVRRLEKYQEETISHSQEVLALRRYVSNHIQKENILEEQIIPIEQMVKELQKKSIAIVGGHHRWQQKMKELLPKAKFIYVDDINRDFNQLLSVDSVFVNDTVLNHGFSYKLMNVMENSNVPIYYLSNAVNRERSLKEIYEYIFE